MIDYRINSWYNITNVKICASKAVSYTHLDVYKRQVCGSSSQQEADRFTGNQDESELEAGLMWQKLHRASTVSYTHLDVYKRQG